MSFKIWIVIVLIAGGIIYFGVKNADNLPKSVGKFIVAVIIIAAFFSGLLYLKHKMTQKYDWN